MISIFCHVNVSACAVSMDFIIILLFANSVALTSMQMIHKNYCRFNIFCSKRLDIVTSFHCYNSSKQTAKVFIGVFRHAESKYGLRFVQACSFIGFWLVFSSKLLRFFAGFCGFLLVFASFCQFLPVFRETPRLR